MRKGDIHLKPLSAESPLSVFPSKSGTLSSTLPLKRSSMPHHQKQKLWLSSDTLDPMFGMDSATETQAVLMKRSYRRINSAHLWGAPKIKDISITDIDPLVGDRPQKYILVEKGRLNEYLKLEQILVEEQRKLGEQCAMQLPGKLKANIPITATRIAIHSVYESQMKKNATVIVELKKRWEKHCRENHFLTNPSYLRDPYLRSASMGERMLKLRVMKEAAVRYRLKRDRDTMSYEDDLSRYVNAYVDAMTRKRDYDRYFVLATQYRPLDEEEFALDVRPGKRYWKRVTQAALSIQMAWSRYWRMISSRRFRVACMIQKIARGYMKRKSVGRLLRKIRLSSKRAGFMHYWTRWLEYIQLCLRIQERIKYYKFKYRNIAFKVLKEHFLEERNIRRSFNRRFARCIRGDSKMSLFTTWKYHVVKSKRLKEFARMSHLVYIFSMWRDFIRLLIHIQFLNRKALRIQKNYRGYLARMVYSKKILSALLITCFARIILAKKRSREKRMTAIAIGLKSWIVVEEERLARKAMNTEVKRIKGEQDYMKAKEVDALNNMKSFFKSSNGHIQVSEIFKAGSEASSTISSGSQPGGFAALSAVATSLSSLLRKPKDVPPSARKKIKQQIMDRSCALARMTARHDHNARSPPFLSCANPFCGATFTSQDQYENHFMLDSAYHSYGTPPYASIHIQMLVPEGCQALRQYLVHRRGMDNVVNCLDAWTAVLEWKRILFSSKDYMEKAMSIYELFIRSDSPRPLRVDFEGLGYINEQFQTLQRRQTDGFFQTTTGPKTILDKLMQRPAMSYERWTDEFVLPADIFNGLQWATFQVVMKAVVADGHLYTESSEFKSYDSTRLSLKIARDNALANLYEARRRRAILDWVKHYCLQEDQIKKRAEVAVSKATEIIVNKAVEIAMQRAVLEVVFEIGYEEQLQHEYDAAIADEASSWAEIDIFEGLFNYYANAILMKMLELNDCRKGLIQYSGIMAKERRQSSRKSLVIDAPLLLRRKSSFALDAAPAIFHEDPWFEPFFRDALAKESKHFPPTKHDLAIIMQRCFRGYLGRSQARKAFAKTFAKKIDPNSQGFYYVNGSYGTASWEKPAIVKRLFPLSQW